MTRFGAPGATARRITIGQAMLKDENGCTVKELGELTGLDITTIARDLDDMMQMRPPLVSREKLYEGNDHLRSWLRNGQYLYRLTDFARGTMDA